MEETTKLNKKVNPDDLTYKYKGVTDDAKFNEFDNAFNLLNRIKNGKISLADAKNDQIKFKLDLSEIKKRNNKNRSEEQKTLCIILK